MKKNIIILIVSFPFIFSGQIDFSKTDQSIIKILNSLAESEGLEFVYGDRFPEINPYGSYGSTYVYDFLTPSGHNPFSGSVLFLCRKKNELYTEKSDENIRDLIFYYDYVLVFAVRETDNDSFKVHTIIENGVGLMGMTLYYGSLRKKLSEFYFIDSPNENGPENKSLNYNNGSIPIVISSESSTTILVYHYGENRWLKYVERDL